MLTFVIRFIVGIAALITVWFGVVEYEEFRRRPLVFAALAAIILVLSLLGSLAAKTANKKHLHPLAFSLPFCLLAAFSGFAIREGIFRPFLVWAAIAAAAMILASVTDRLLRTSSVVSPKKV
jgi:hypothetical protein